MNDRSRSSARIVCSVLPPGSRVLSVSGSATAASVRIASARPASTTKIPCQEVNWSTAAPIIGARIGASPVTSISELNSFAAAAPV